MCAKHEPTQPQSQNLLLLLMWYRSPVVACEHDEHPRRGGPKDDLPSGQLLDGIKLIGKAVRLGTGVKAFSLGTDARRPAQFLWRPSLRGLRGLRGFRGLRGLLVESKAFEHSVIARYVPHFQLL